MKNNAGMAIALTVICLILGFIISVQYHTNEASLSDLTLQSNEDLVIILGELHQQQEDLTEQEKSLTAELNILKEANLSEEEALKSLNEENQYLNAAVGREDVQGQGVILTIDNQDELIATDILLIVNELWNAGAEAISVNDMRLSNTSSFATAGTEAGIIISLNKTELSFPLTIKAIGDKISLSTALTFPGGVLENLKNEMKLDYKTEAVDNIIIPAASE